MGPNVNGKCGNVKDIPSGGVERGLLAALGGGSELDLIDEYVGRTANDVKTLGLIRDDVRGGGSGIVDV